MSWLMNLDFAGGGGAEAASPGGVVLSRMYRAQRKRYGYGYRYMVRWPLWT